MALTDKASVELVQDFIGAAYWDRNLRCLKVAGRMVMVGLMGGIKVEANLNVIMGKRLRIMGSVMRSQPLQNKIAITRRFQERWLPLLESGVLSPSSTQDSRSRMQRRRTDTWKETVTSVKSY